MKVENIRENNYACALKESRVVLVCQHLFNLFRKKNYANVHRNMINDGNSQTSLLPIFSVGRGTSVYRLSTRCSDFNSRYLISQVNLYIDIIGNFKTNTTAISAMNRSCTRRSSDDIMSHILTVY